MSKLALFPAAILLGAIFVVFPVPVFGDPPVTPPNPDTVLPKLFCLRVTDIRADKTDPENDKFTFEFEVLNWSNQQADDLHFALTAESGDVIFTDAGVDQDGRPLVVWPTSDTDPTPLPDEDTNGNGQLDPGEDLPILPDFPSGDGRITNDKLEGNLFTDNTWLVESQTATSINWESPVEMGYPSEVDFEFPSFIPLAHAGECVECEFPTQPIPNANILGNAGTTTQVNNYVIAITGATSIDGAGNVNPREAIDNGFNTLDGFTFTVDNFGDGDSFAINWFLTNQGGLIGSSFGGNDYGFGVIGIARADTGSLPNPIYIGNTGFQSTLLEFYGNVNVVPDPAITALELGAGVTAPFKNPNDNPLGAGNGINFFAPLGSVGGMSIPIDSTSLVVAGTQSTISWLIPLLVSAIGIGIVLARRN